MQRALAVQHTVYHMGVDAILTAPWVNMVLALFRCNGGGGGGGPVGGTWIGSLGQHGVGRVCLTSQCNNTMMILHLCIDRVPGPTLGWQGVFHIPM